MPIRAEFRELYPADWREISAEVRFVRAGGRCQRCARPHGATLRVLPDGRWFDPLERTWRDGRGKPARWPDLEMMIAARTTRVVLAAAHLNHNPGVSRWRNLRAFCQRCHLIHDRPQHLRQRWITCRRRYALGDLFLGFYAELSRRLALGPAAADPGRAPDSNSFLHACVITDISDRLGERASSKPNPRLPSLPAGQQVTDAPAG